MSHETLSRPTYEQNDLTAYNPGEADYDRPASYTTAELIRRVDLLTERFEHRMLASSARIDAHTDPAARAIREADGWMWGTTERTDSKGKKVLRRVGAAALRSSAAGKDAATRTVRFVGRRAEHSLDTLTDTYGRTRAGVGRIALAASALQPAWHKKRQAREAERIIANAEQKLNAGPLDSPVNGIDFWARHR